MITISGTNNFFIGKLSGLSPFLAKIVMGGGKSLKSLLKWKSVAKKAERDIISFFEKDPVPIFSYVEIETINRCNGVCSFCPVNKNADPRPYAKMSEETFKKIIDNLAELNFSGCISYYSNNEPLMDTRIIEFIKYGVYKLPLCTHQILSNGTLLTEEKFQKFIDSGLNNFHIDNYNDRLKMNPNIQNVYDKYASCDFRMSCSISLRYQDQILSSRGGNAPNKSKPQKTINAHCYYPFSQLIIRADSGVSLCCNDALGKITIGNVENQTLQDIWFGEKHINILKSIRDNKRNDIDVCKGCDFVASKKDSVWK